MFAAGDRFDEAHPKVFQNGSSVSMRAVDSQTMSPIFAVLALIALATALVAGAALITGEIRPSRPSPTLVLIGAAAIALTATAGSLFYSESAGFIPCEFCWYQRIAMYPLAVILSIAAVRRDVRIWPYGLALSSIGLALSCYHYYLQHWFHGTTSCAAESPCTAIWVEEFGFVTIPFMAGCGFICIAMLMIVLARCGQRGVAPVSTPTSAPAAPAPAAPAASAPAPAASEMTE